MEMSTATLRQLCKEQELFQTPELNDILYCNFQGFTSLAGLGPYTSLKALFLEGNALETLRDLPPLDQLKCL